MIILEDVSFSYPPNEHSVFSNLNVDFESGTWIAIVGPDGSGKTTLAKLIEGRLTPDRGSISISEKTDALTVGYIGGDPSDTIVGICVEEDIVFGLENLGLDARRIGTRLRQALEWTGLQGMERRLVHTLSGGEQQKLALAGALAAGTRVLILDEALSMLDRRTRRSIRDLISELRRQTDLTVIEITHFPEDIAAAERVLFLSEGKVGFDGNSLGFLRSTYGRSWMELSGGVSALGVELHRRGLVPVEHVDLKNIISIITNNIDK